jgi:DNA polymerase-3 subunit beta
MKFIVSSSYLLKQLQVLGSVINSSNTLPILDNFLFELDHKNLSVSASDLETTMSATLEIDSTSKGSVAVPAKLLLDILKTFPEQPLTFTVEENSTIEISSNSGKYAIAYAPGEEFPKSVSLDNPSSTVVPSEVLATAISKTIFAAGNDDLRPVMSGVLMQVGAENLTMVATDSHRLVRYRRNDVKCESEESFIIPKKPLNLLKNLLGYVNGNVEIRFNARNASFSFDHIRIICRLIEGRYPNYDAVIPKENPFRLVMNRQDLVSSIRRVAIFSSKSSSQVKLAIQGSELNLTAEDLDYANSANERLACQYNGEDMEIAFNAKFISEMLSNLDSERISLNMSAPNRAGILLPDSDTPDADEDLLMLVMPVMTNN